MNKECLLEDLFVFQHLAALLITTQIVGQFQESVVPFLFHRRRAAKVDKAMKKMDVIQKVEFFNGEVGEDLQKQTSVESIMDVYEVCNLQSSWKP